MNLAGGGPNALECCHVQQHESGRRQNESCIIVELCRSDSSEGNPEMRAKFCSCQTRSYVESLLARGEIGIDGQSNRQLGACPFFSVEQWRLWLRALLPWPRVTISPTSCKILPILSYGVPYLAITARRILSAALQADLYPGLANAPQENKSITTRTDMSDRLKRGSDLLMWTGYRFTSFCPKPRLAYVLRPSEGNQVEVSHNT